MGGELGSLVASLLETEPWVGSILGIDVDPPRRRLRRSEFHLIEPSDRQRIVDVVTRFDPACARSPRRVGARCSSRDDRGEATHQPGRHLRTRSRRGMSVAGGDRGAQRHRDLRPRSWRADPSGRGFADAPDQRVRPDGGRSRSVCIRRGRTCWRGRQRPPLGAGTRTARAQPARESASATGRAVQPAWPIPRSWSCSIPTRRWLSSPQPSNDRKAR